MKNFLKIYAKFAKMAQFHGKFPKNIFFHGKFLLGNITVESMKKLPMSLRNFLFHALNKTTKPVLGKFPTKVKISMTISTVQCF
jgi:hypothetical protein